MKLRLIAALAVLLASAVALVPSTTRRAAADDPAWYDDHVKVTLKDLQANPTSFKTAKVRFKAMYNRIEAIFNPAYTPFVPEQYVAFSIWDIEKKLWVKADRMKDFPFCFMRKDNKYLPQAAAAKRYMVVEVIAVVANDFNNTPWLEVLRMDPVTDRRLTDKSLHHIIAGYEYLNAGQPALAEHEYWEALKYELPDDAHLTVLEELTKIAFEAHRWKEAEDLAHQILNMDDENQLGRDIYRAAREEMVREYNTGAPHGIEGPSGTDNAHPANQDDPRGRRSSALPKVERPEGPVVAKAEKPAATPADSSARLSADATRKIAELERKLGERDRLLAERSARLAEIEAEASLLRQEKARVMEEQAKYSGEVDSVRAQLASLQVEKDKLAGEAAALKEQQADSAETLRQEVAELEARKAEAEQALAGRDALAAELAQRAKELEGCKADLTAVMAQRDEVTREIAARKTEVDELLGRRDGLAKELETRKAELDRTLATGTDQTRELDAQVRELEARRAELESVSTRAAEAGQEEDAIARALAERKNELEGMLARRDELTRELEARGRALDAARAEAEAELARRDRLQGEVAQAEQALATLSARASEPKEETPSPDLAAQLKEITARQELLVSETSRLRREAAEKDARIATLQREIGARNLRVAALEQTVHARDLRIGALEGELGQTRARQGRQATLLKEIEGQLATLEARIGQGSANESATPEAAPASPWRGRRTPDGRRSPVEMER